MKCDAPGDDLRRAWQAQAGAERRPTAEEVATMFSRLRRRTRRRNLAGLGVCALVGIVCLWWLSLVARPLAETGAVLTVLAVAVLGWQLHANRRAAAAAFSRPASAAGATTLAFHREELTRQRDFHRGWRLWTRLLLFVPGPQLFFAGFSREHPEVATTILFVAIAALVLLIAAVPVNLHLARGYQRQLDELDHRRED
jgi:hypothetical protein